jgi:hypothetical protein
VKLVKDLEIQHIWEELRATDRACAAAIKQSAAYAPESDKHFSQGNLHDQAGHSPASALLCPGNLAYKTVNNEKQCSCSLTHFQAMR